MNCFLCQERLDERLDQLRVAFPDATFEVLRAKAVSALEEVARQCPDCQGELRAHLSFRLALMRPATEPVEVPSALRFNVRRALDRETAPRFSFAKRPFVGFAWTGGAVLSAVVLFVVARPLLMEQSQKTFSSAQNEAPAADVGSVAPKAEAPALESQNSTSSGAPVPAVGAKPPVAVPPTPGSDSTPPKLETPSGQGKGKPLASDSNAASPERAPSLGAKDAAQPALPAPNSESPKVPLGRSAPPLAQSSPAQTGSMPKNSRFGSAAPVLGRTRIEKPRSGFGASSPPVVASKELNTRLNGGIATRVRPSLLAPEGKALGFSVRIAPAEQSTPPTTGSLAPSPKGAAPPSIAPPQDAPPGSSAPATGAPSQEAPVPVNPRSSKRDPSSDSVAPPGDAPALDAEGSVSQEFHNDLAPPRTIQVSVEHDVSKARVTGQIERKGSHAVVLWSGEAQAKKPIPVSLAPLNATSGDKVTVSIEQQVSSSQTKILATTSVVVP